MGLNVAPRFDEATEFSYKWNANLMQTDLNDEVSCHLLEDDAVPSDAFLDKLALCNFFIFYDHGNETSLIGQNGLVLIRKDEARHLKNKKVFTMACSSAKELGVEAYKKGCLEYWGAIAPIGFTPSEEGLFEEVYNLGAYLRFKENRPIQEVLDAMELKFDENIQKATDPWTKVWLRTDRDIWRCWSDETPPTEDNTKCFARRTAVKLFGAKGWKIPNLGDIWNSFTRLFS